MKQDPRPVTIAAKTGHHIAALGLDPEANAMAMYGDIPRLVFHGIPEAQDFLNGLAQQGVQFPPLEIRIVPLDHCQGCGGLRISQETDPEKAPKLCEKCQILQEEQSEK